MNLSLTAARAIHLAAQGLLTPVKKPAQKEDVLACIQRMGALQIDTISVVARSPYLVLWSRLGDYPQCWLEELLTEGRIFEYWSHEACFLPIEHYGRYRHRMLTPEGLGWKYNHQWLSNNADQVAKVREHIRQHGACRSADFERNDGIKGGWWEWKPEKRALEVLFSLGELMVARRQKFQRVYDLRERVHPEWRDKRDLPKKIDSQRHQVLDAIRALGICKASWVADYFRMEKLSPHLQPAHLAAQGLLLITTVQGWDEPFYLHPSHQNLLEQAQRGELQAKHTCLLSPFDPIVWDRKRAKELFNFDYKLECYTPAEKRQYGYFTLPILRRGELIGRIDAKAHRKDGILEIKSLHTEAKVRISQALAKDLAKAIKQFAHWHECPTITLGYCASAELQTLLKEHILP